MLRSFPRRTVQLLHCRAKLYMICLESRQQRSITVSAKANTNSTNRSAPQEKCSAQDFKVTPSSLHPQFISYLEKSTVSKDKKLYITLSIEKFLEVYTFQQSDNLFGNLFKRGYRKEALLLMDFLVFHMRSQNEVKVLMLNSITSLYLEKDYILLVILMEKLFKRGYLTSVLQADSEESIEFFKFAAYHKNNIGIYNDSEKIPTAHEFNISLVEEFIIRYVVELGIANNRSIIVAALIIKLYQNNIQISNSVLSLIADALLISDPITDDYQIDSILKIVSIFPSFQLTPIQLIQLFSKSLYLDSDGYPYFASKIFHLILQKKSEIMEQQSTEFLSLAYKYMEKNIEFENNATVYSTWYYIKDLRKIENHNLKTVSKIIRQFCKNHSYLHIATEIVKSIPPIIQGDPHIAGALLKYATYTNNTELATDIMKKIRPPMSDSLLTDLLNLHLSCNDDDGAEKVLKEIIKSETGLNHGQFNIIVTNLIKRNRLKESIDVCLKSNIEVARSAYISIMGHHIREDIPFHKEFTNKFWETFFINGAVLEENFKNIRTAILVQYMIKKLPIHKVLTFVQNNIDSGVGDSIRGYRSSISNEVNLFKLKPETLSEYIGEFQLEISDAAKIMCLRIIGDYGIKNGRMQVFKWSILQLLFAGFDDVSIFIEWSRRYKSSFSKMGFDIDSDMKKTGCKTPDEFWRFHGLSRLKSIFKTNKS